MSKNLMDISEFRARLLAASDVNGADLAAPKRGLRFVPVDEPLIASGERVATFVFSDNSVDRYGDTIDAKGWVIERFLNNPVALFGHDSGSVENVIGKARNVRIDGNRLVGEIEFMEAAINPAAETVYQMVKGGYLNTVSVGFLPIEWEFTKDKERPYGIDFKRQELLEISIVPVPANANAVVQAKAAGIDVDRLQLRAAEDWKVDASRDLSIDDKDRCDGPTSASSNLEFIVEEAPDHKLEAAKVRVLELLIGADAATVALVEQTMKAGKVISAANSKKLKDAHGAIIGACDVIMSVADTSDADEPDSDGDEPADTGKAAMRARKARALKRKLTLVA